MSAIIPALIGMVAIALGYFFYSKFIAEKIYQLDPDFETPAHTLRDDVDFIPTNRIVLWGHHFTAVAGAAPIIGPAIAVIWGWLPAFIWVIGGTVFFAGVHDFGAIWASVRNQGRSVGSLTGDVVSVRARTLFMIVIFFLLMMVNAVFAVAISNAFVATPSSVIPAWTAIAVAVVIGVLIYKVKVPILWPTIIGTIILYAVIYVGDQVPVSLPETFMGLGAAPQWIIILFIYATVASLLPVWLLLQPRDYINGIQLIIGLALLFGAVFIANPDIVAPWYNRAVPEGTPHWFPLLFVTIACGALSGFHGLVSSGTTSKQLNKETDARFVGYLGSSGEGLLALVTIIAVSAGFASLGEWQTTYSDFYNGGLGISTFVAGGSAIVEAGTPLSREFAQTLLAVMAVLFAGTTMDAGVRLQRYIVQEWGTIYKIPVLQNGYIATFAAVAACLALAFGAGGADGQGGMLIWPLFGTTNQLLAGLTLLVLSVMLVKLKRRYIFTLVPMMFVTLMAFLAAIYQLWDLFTNGSYVLMTVDIVVIILAIFVLLESSSAFTREKRA
ncbi:MAG: carbon starvation protein A, partial [Gemmatimonadetes bacterium]|nr:carbon starvation protein A [Gemmatimonadota bacterium]